MDKYHYFTCSNPRCNLRFPSFRDGNCSDQCPRCKSPLEKQEYPVTPQQTAQSNRYNAPKVSVLLDNIRSAFNVGSMFRTSDGAGVKHIYLCGVTSTPHNPKVAKTSLGAETSIPWSYHTNSLQLCADLKREHRLVALESIQGAVSLFEVDQEVFENSILLIVGNEVTGVDPELLTLCDQVISIPMAGAKHSLNVAIAFGVAIYTICQSRIL